MTNIHSLVRRMRSWFRPEPRQSPFGEGVKCDACRSTLPLRPFENGGYYCPGCIGEIEDLYGIRSAEEANLARVRENYRHL